MGSKKQKVAVFDVDGTIFRSSLFIQLVERLIEQGSLPQSLRQSYAREEERWVNREGEYDAYVAAMVRASEKHFSGVSQKEFDRAAAYVVKAQWKRVYRYTRDLIKELKKKDYFLLAVSHSPKIILDHFCPRLGFDKWYGFLYEVDEKKRLTGKAVDPEVILNKASILKRAVDHQSLTLQGSIGVGDSESDASFLKLVEKPICFNPSSKLYAKAKRNGWQVVVERKDVIYTL